MQMGQRKKQSSHEYNHSPTTLLMALFSGVCALITVESICGGANDAGWQQMNRLPAWQVHMGSTCVGIITFFVFLLILEFLETKSRITAWRSSAPWLPLVGFTALATIVHIPFCIVHFPFPDKLASRFPISQVRGFSDSFTAERSFNRYWAGTSTIHSPL
jgi:hypothetical protein